MTSNRERYCRIHHSKWTDTRSIGPKVIKRRAVEQEQLHRPHGNCREMYSRLGVLEGDGGRADSWSRNIERTSHPLQTGVKRWRELAWSWGQ